MTAKIFIPSVPRFKSISGACHCYGNARMESFFAMLKKEKLYRMDTAMLNRDAVKRDRPKNRSIT